MADGRVVIDTELDESGAKSGLSKLGRTLSGIGGVVLKGTAVAVGAVSTAIAGLGTTAVKYNADMEQYQTSFEVMTGSATKAEEVMTKLKEVGAKTPFEFEDLAQAEQLLMNYGFTADDAMGKMMMLGDISQGSAEKMQRIATAYGQMSSAGKVQLEDVKQMIEAGFNPLQEISQSTGESMDSLYDRISKGTISVDEITASMERSTSAGGKYFESMDKQSQTVAGQFSTLKDNFQQMTGEIFGGLSESVGSQLLPLAIGWVEQLTTAFQDGGVPALAAAIGNILSEAVTMIAEYAPMIVNLAITIITEFVNGIIANLPTIIQSAITIMNSLVNGILQMLPLLLQAALQIIIQLALGLSQSLPQMIPQIVNIIITMVQILIQNAPMLIQAGLMLIIGLATGLIQALPQLIEMLPEIVIAIVEALIAAAPLMLNAAFELTRVLGVGLYNAMMALDEKIKQLVQILVDKFSALKEKFLGVGKNIIDGIWQGIQSGWKWLTDKVGELAQGLLNAAKSVLGIHSPSKEFAWIGRMSAEGMVVGFDDVDPVGEIKSSLAGSLGNIQTNVSAMDSGRSGIVSSALSNIATTAGYAGDLVFKIGETEVARTLLSPLLNEMNRQGYNVEVIGG